MCAEVLNSPQEQQQHVADIVCQSLSAIRKHPRVGPNVPIVVFIEACTTDASYIAPYFLQGPLRDNVIVLSEINGGNRYGVQKNVNTLKNMITSTIVVLSYNLLAIPSDCIPLTSSYCHNPKTMRDYKEALARQFSGFRVNPDTGKINGKYSGNDDILITLMMNMYWSSVFCTSMRQDYEDFKSHFDQEVWYGGKHSTILASGAYDPEKKRKK